MNSRQTGHPLGGIPPSVPLRGREAGVCSPVRAGGLLAAGPPAATLVAGYLSSAFALLRAPQGHSATTTRSLPPQAVPPQADGLQS